jgi:DtxR family Mn-dependent transcriptional regulator
MPPGRRKSHELSQKYRDIKLRFIRITETRRGRSLAAEPNDKTQLFAYSGGGAAATIINILDKNDVLSDTKKMTESLEDYLEMVSFLSDDGEVRVTDIASRLAVSKPSVLAALKILEGQELIQHEKYQSVTLTKTGAQQAAEIRKRHRFLAEFLTGVVGVDGDTAEKDACKMEHVLSPETLKKMKALAEAARKP